MGETILRIYTSRTDGVLADICEQPKELISLADSSVDTYVSTENMLEGKGGIRVSTGLPASGKVVRFKKNDTLVANIRPYFKKIWKAEYDGTCSSDVVVFRAQTESLASYLYFTLRQDSFFEHIMLGAKGTKMPRGDKKQMMAYPVATSYEAADLNLLNALAEQIASNNQSCITLSQLRDALLPKLMSGEIDVSQVDLMQLNGHLSDG